MPQEMADPIAFDHDRTERPYNHDMAVAWWRIMIGVQDVLRTFHGRFAGKVQEGGLMWGTFDFRTAIYNGKPAAPAPDADFIRRNAMNAELMEMGWWPGDRGYPEPKVIATAKLSPSAARWEPTLGEFLLDHDALRASKDRDRNLLAFFETTYALRNDLRGRSRCGGVEPGIADQR